MARNRQPILKKCRALGIDPTVLGVNKKSNRGPRPNANTKPTEYAVQLKEKQKAKFVYGVMEKQFYKLYEEASRKDGVTGENLVQYLERRLDNVVYRLGFVKTRKQARQVVSHAHILVNGKRVNIASYRVKAGDVVAVAEASKNIAIIKEAVEEGKSVPSWLEIDAAKFAGKVLQNPNRDVVDFELNEALIVEFYSR
jgi:small subunit ribosomal protein S4